MRKLQLLGDSAMWLVIAGVLSLCLIILVLVGLLAIVRELIGERSHETNSMDDEATGTGTGTGEVGRASGQRCGMMQ
jgi:hypothetical protein